MTDLTKKVNVKLVESFGYDGEYCNERAVTMLDEKVKVGETVLVYNNQKAIVTDVSMYNAYGDDVEFDSDKDFYTVSFIAEDGLNGNIIIGIN